MGNKRVLHIDLDDTTDSEMVNGDDPHSELGPFETLVEECISSDDEMDIELIDEFVFEGNPSQETQIITEKSMAYQM